MKNTLALNPNVKNIMTIPVDNNYECCQKKILIKRNVEPI